MISEQERLSLSSRTLSFLRAPPLLTPHTLTQPEAAPLLLHKEQRGLYSKYSGAGLSTQNPELENGFYGFSTMSPLLLLQSAGHLFIHIEDIKCPNCSNFQTAPSRNLRHLIAMCEGDKMNSSGDMRATDRQHSLHSVWFIFSTYLCFITEFLYRCCSYRSQG